MARKVEKKRGKKLGQAAVLPGKMWTQWRNHILKTFATWLYVVVTLTHALCARVSEVLKLRASDLHWFGKAVTIKHVCRLSCTLEVSPFARVSRYI